VNLTFRELNSFGCHSRSCRDCVHTSDIKSTVHIFKPRLLTWRHRRLSVVVVYGAINTVSSAHIASTASSAKCGSTRGLAVCLCWRQWWALQKRRTDLDAVGGQIHIGSRSHVLDGVTWWIRLNDPYSLAMRAVTTIASLVVGWYSFLRHCIWRMVINRYVILKISRSTAPKSFCL